MSWGRWRKRERKQGPVRGTCRPRERLDRETDIRGQRKVDSQTPLPSDTHAGQRESDPWTRDRMRTGPLVTNNTNKLKVWFSPPLPPYPPSPAPVPQQPHRLTHLLQL